MDEILLFGYGILAHWTLSLPLLSEDGIRNVSPVVCLWTERSHCQADRNRASVVRTSLPFRLKRPILTRGTNLHRSKMGRSQTVVFSSSTTEHSIQEANNQLNRCHTQIRPRRCFLQLNGLSFQRMVSILM